jgi:phage RecT family recombinase
MPETAMQKRDYTPLETALLASRKSLTTLLGSQEKADALIVEVLNMARKAPDLHRCSPESIQYAVVRIASLHLNPALPNEVTIIPRGGKAEPQYGYGGLRKLVLRSPDVVDCFAREVRVNDTFAPPPTPVALPVHQLPGGFEPRGRVIGYYAVAQMRNGNWRYWPMSVAEVEKHRDQYAQKNQKGDFFVSWSRGMVDREGLSGFDKMGMKTCLRMLCNPRDFSLEPEVYEAIKAEESLMQPTAAEWQGYQHDGSRPAIATHATGASFDDLMDALSGDSRGVQETITQERQGKREKGKVAAATTTEPEHEHLMFDPVESAAADRALAAQEHGHG